MRYQLLALVHGCRVEEAARPAGAVRSVPALVDYGKCGERKRVVAVIDAAHVLTGDEVQSMASMLCCQLQRSFERKGMTLSRAELVPA